MGVRDWERRKKPRPPCSGVDTGGNLTWPERELTSARCFVAREAARTDVTKGEQMTAAAERRPTGAPSNRPVEWESIDWKAAHRQVNRLQMRIAKAVREPHFHKVKALQWLLTHSFYAKVLAVRRVMTNRGRRSPGVDGVVWKTPQDAEEATWSLGRRGYRPQPRRRGYLTKPNGTLRPLGIPTMQDRAREA